MPILYSFEQLFDPVKFFENFFEKRISEKLNISVEIATFQEHPGRPFILLHNLYTTGRLGYQFLGSP